VRRFLRPEIASRSPASRARTVFAKLASVASRPAVAVPAIVLAGFALTAFYAFRVDEWIVQTDELLYVRLALGIGDDLSLAPQLRGQHYAVYSQLYPLLLAPVYGLLDNPTAFKGAHLLNALLMASTAVPAYLLARAVELPRYAAYAVAALTVAVPWMSMASILWTESAGYPAFAWAVLACHRCIVEPRTRNDLLALAALALAFFARTQFALLVFVLPAALLLHEVGWSLRRDGAPVLRRLWRAFLAAGRNHRALLAAYAIGAIVAFAGSGDPRQVLGNYATTSFGDLLPPGTLIGAGRLVDALAVGIGVVPLFVAAGWALSTLIQPGSRARHGFAVLGLVLVPAIVFQASSFAIRFSNGLNDRYVFYVVPVLFVGMALCLVEGRRRWYGVAVAGVAMAMLVDLLTYEPWGVPPFASPTGAFYPVIEGRSYQIGRLFGVTDLAPATLIEIGTLAATALIVVGLIWLPRRVLFGAVMIPLLLFCVVQTQYVLRVMSNFNGSGGIVTGGPALTSRDWIDDALPPGASAALVPGWVGDSVTVTERVWWQAEFWNSRVRDVYGVDHTYTPFPARTITVDANRGAVRAPRQTKYLVVSNADLRFRLAGQSISKGFIYLELIRAETPFRADWVSTDLLPDGWTLRGTTARIRIFSQPGRGEGRAVRLALTAPGDVKSPRRFTLRSSVDVARGRLVPPDGATSAVVTACVPRGGFTDVTLAVAGSNRMPPPDTREIGLRVRDIDVTDASVGASHRSRRLSCGPGAKLPRRVPF
jgi:hypothetical protein